MTDLLAEIERRAAEAYQTVYGPDYKAIITDVAEEAKVSYRELRNAWLDSSIVGPN